jgi:hypothetical protein
MHHQLPPVAIVVGVVVGGGAVVVGDWWGAVLGGAVVGGMVRGGMVGGAGVRGGAGVVPTGAVGAGPLPCVGGVADPRGGATDDVDDGGGGAPAAVVIVVFTGADAVDAVGPIASVEVDDPGAPGTTAARRLAGDAPAANVPMSPTMVTTLTSTVARRLRPAAWPRPGRARRSVSACKRSFVALI